MKLTKMLMLGVSPVICIALSGCHSASAPAEVQTNASPQSTSTSGGSPASPAIHVPTLSTEIPARDEARQVYPLDVLYLEDVGRLEAAAYLTAKSACMAEKGYTVGPIHIDVSAPLAETQSAGINPIFNEAIAAKYGYRLAPDPSMRLVPDIQAKFGADKLNEDEIECGLRASAEAAGKSLEEFREIIGSPDAPIDTQPDADVLESIGSRLNRLTHDPNFPGLPEATERWHECMLPLGIPDLPDSPWPNGSMGLPPSLLEKWDYETTGTPSADEIAVATHDANCRRASGWFDAFYDAKFTAQEEFFKENYDEILPRIQEEQENVQRYVQILSGKS